MIYLLWKSQQEQHCLQLPSLVYLVHIRVFAHKWRMITCRQQYTNTASLKNRWAKALFCQNQLHKPCTSWSLRDNSLSSFNSLPPCLLRSSIILSIRSLSGEKGSSWKTSTGALFLICLLWRDFEADFGVGMLSSHRSSSSSSVEPPVLARFVAGAEIPSFCHFIFNYCTGLGFVWHWNLSCLFKS